jgi:nitroreductase
MIKSELITAITDSQHCQRNWDLTKSVPADDISIIVHAATQCPSKQNIAYYKLHVITNRLIIEHLHELTRHNSRSKRYTTETNSQIMANLVLVFEKNNYCIPSKIDIFRNEETKAILDKSISPQQALTLQRDSDMAIGIASGYANLSATLMSYQTGFCACFDSQGIKLLLNLENDPVLLMGIGFNNPTKDRKVHHLLPDLVFSTKRKQPIQVTYQ